MFFVIPAGIMFFVLMLLFCLSLSRSAISQLNLTDAKILHKNKQRLYTFYQRKDKIKASVSACEILLSLIFVFCAFSLIKSEYNVFNEVFPLFEFYGDTTFQYIITFVSIAFLLVITIEIPTRMYSETQKEKFLLKTSWLTDFVYAVFSPFVFSMPKWNEIFGFQAQVG